MELSSLLPYQHMFICMHTSLTIEQVEDVEGKAACL